jgi:ABC-type branched-subunit amino acid transport system permease subunit
VLWALCVVAGYSVVLLPRERAAELATTWWPLLVLLVLGVQAALIWLLSRLMALQLPGERR